MAPMKRRHFIFCGFATATSLTLHGCKSQDFETAGEKLLKDSNESLDKLFDTNPEMRNVYDKAAGTLIIPRITKAGFMFGGSYGEGVLKIGEAAVDYYSVAAASFGYQLGAIQYSNAIFFMTQDSLKTFRLTDGWEIGADAEVFFRKKGASIGITNNTVTKPIYAVVFGQRGVIAGASLEGAKYSRLIR